MDSKTPKLVLITGGHGFIGSHVAKRLYQDDNLRIRIVDIAPKSSLEGPLCHEFIHGTLTDEEVCHLSVVGVHTVLHFAANMGGMGTIHERNNFLIYKENHSITTNILEASVGAGVSRFFYASSACVYPETLQSDPNMDVSLREADVFMHLPPRPQELYGTEKLAGEVLVAQFSSKMDVRTARFHNVFGPGGAWNDGREKAPAAMLRKAVVMKLLGAENWTAPFEIWGSGSQRRSFLYIDDAVDGVLRFLESRHTGPFNIGSDCSVSVKELADLSLRTADVDPSSVKFSYDHSRPTGVSSRNSNNDAVRKALGWSPAISLQEGLKRTEAWIREQVRANVGPDLDAGSLAKMLQSQVLHLEPEVVVFALLLPITSRGCDSPNDCLDNLRRFAKSLTQTTRHHSRHSLAIRFKFTVYLAIDEDDLFLHGDSPSDNKAARVLREEGILHIVTLYCNHPRGHVCKIWKECARKAHEDHCDYIVLLGDDVELKDEGWMAQAHAEFKALASTSKAPFGFGCVAFTDVSFPGMPTFPIIHRNHMEIFNGEVIPEIFVNQDGDPFLFQLYRRWGCSSMFSCRISNSMGGAGSARYAKQHAQDWTFATLDNASAEVEGWLSSQKCKINKKITLDIIIPCYRVNLAVIETILDLKSSDSCSVSFIVIIDNPSSPHIFELETRYSYRPDVRIRLNQRNLGASASRNRGMKESAADWVQFLDDDIVPEPDILFRAEDAIRAHPTAAGFVGNAVFPCADSVFTTAVHLAGVTYFWDIASKIDNDVPWGVTANLIARRLKDDIEFDLRYPKTGGGEDIDFCRMKREFSLQHHGLGFMAAPEVKVIHPWWNDGKRSYWRFHNWSVGDGALVKQFPQLSYIDLAPNSAELLALCVAFGFAGCLSAQWKVGLLALQAVPIVLAANVLHDCYRHFYQHPERDAAINSSLRGWLWLLAVIESTFIRVFSEIGRLRGMILRGEWEMIGHRFDWFAGRIGRGPVQEERKNKVQRTILFLLLFSIAR